MADQESPAVETVEQGAYEIIRRRLESQADELGKRARALNERRLEVFGGTEIALVGIVEMLKIPKRARQIFDEILAEVDIE